MLKERLILPTTLQWAGKACRHWFSCFIKVRCDFIYSAPGIPVASGVPHKVIGLNQPLAQQTCWATNVHDQQSYKYKDKDKEKDKNNDKDNDNDKDKDKDKDKGKDKDIM